MKLKNMLLITLVLLLAGCVSVEKNELPPPGEITWEQVPAILLSGEVDSVFQNHARDVAIHMKDGTEYQTVAPQLDDIFKEVEPIKIKSHGDKAKSIFRHGYDYLRRLIINIRDRAGEFFENLSIILDGKQPHNALKNIMKD